MTLGPKQQVLVWWILWGAFQSGLFLIYFLLGSTSIQASPSSESSFGWLAAAIPVVLSAIIRWLVLPHARNVQGALQIFIIGICLAEATCFLGLFLFPAHKLGLFVISALGIFQYLPYFAGRYIAP